jgi:FK506-binding protein 6
MKIMDTHNFDDLNVDNVDEKLKELKLIGPDYESDDERDKVRLTGKGIDIQALKAGNDIEFELDSNNDDNYNWYDESDKIDYEKIFRYRNLDMIVGDSTNPDDESNSNKTPFEILRTKMYDISPDKDQGVLKRIINPGCGIVIPNGSRARIHYNAYFEMNDEPFDSTHLRNKTFEFKLGVNQVVIGLDIAVATMKKYEKSQFIFAPEYYCGKQGCEPRVPRDTPVMFEIEIISFIEANAFDRYEETCEEQRKKISFEEMVKICNCLRELGNDNYIRHNFREASKKYRKSIYLLDNVNVENEEQENKWNSVMLKLYLNMSQVCLKQSKPKKTIYYCKLALDKDPNNVKALFRYGQSLRLLQDFDRSRQFLVKAYTLAPTNVDIKEEINKLNDMIKKYKMLEKDIYKKMFSNTSANHQCELKFDSANLDEKTKSTIINNLQEFRKNDKMKVLKIQHAYIQPQMKEFLIEQAKIMGFDIRNIKGDTSDISIIQILKI